MTKQQAYELAWQEFSNIERTESNLRNRAMEIYAAAFTEWTENKYMQTPKEDKRKVWIEVYSSDCPTDLEPEYTTAELLTEFEKQ